MPEAVVTETNRSPRPKGRPKEGSTPPEALDAKPFPAPPRPTEKFGYIPPEKLFEYYRGLSEDLKKDRAMFYVNRLWPVMDHLRPFSPEERRQIEKKEKRGPIEYCGKYDALDPDGYLNTILRSHGEGDYKIFLNDGGVRGNKNLRNQNITRCMVKIRDAEFPPVLDLNLLDLNDPQNQSYMQGLRDKGISIPGDPASAKKEEGDAVATATAIEKLTDSFIEVTKDRAATNANGKQEANVTSVLTTVLSTDRQRAIEEQRLAADREKRLEERHQDEMRALRAQMVEVQREAKERADAAERAAKERATEPLQGLQGLAGVLEKLMPKAAPQDNTLITVVLQGLEKRLESAEAFNRQLLEKIMTPAAPPAATPPVELGLFDKVLKLYEKLDNFKSGGGPASSNPWIELAQTLGPDLLQTLQSVTYNISAMSSAGKIQPAAPSPLPSTGEQPQQQPESEEQKQMNIMRQYAKQIYPLLVQSLDGQEKGYKLAGRIIAQFGPVAYQAVIQGGKDGLYQMLYSDAEVKGGLLRYGQRLDAYLDEFLQTQNAMAEAQQIQAMGQMTQPPPPPQQPIQPSQVIPPDRQPTQPITDASGVRYIIDPTTGQKVKVSSPRPPVIIDGQATAS